MSHETIRIRLEKHLPYLDHLVSLQLLTTDEVRDIMDERTAYEYKVCCGSPLYRDFADFIAYEKSIREKIRKKGSELGVSIPYKWMKQLDGWINKLYDRMVLKVGKNDFRKKEACIIEYVEYLAEIKNIGMRNAVLTQALEADPTNENIWMLLLRYNSKEITDIFKWRGLLSRATRLCGQNADIYRLWITTEIAHVEKLIVVILESTEDPDRKAAIERLLPLEEVPAAIFSSYLSNITQERIRSDGINLLQSFLGTCRTPWGRRMIELMGELFLTQSKGIDGSILHQTVKSLVSKVIEDYETTENRSMYSIYDFIESQLNPDAKKDADEFDVVTDDEGDIMTEKLPKQDVLFEVFLRAFGSNGDSLDRREFTHNVAMAFERFVGGITKISDEYGVHLRDLLESLKAQSVNSIDLSCDMDVAPEVLRSFVALFAKDTATVLTLFIQVLRHHVGLLRSPESLSILASCVQSGLIDSQTVFLNASESEKCPLLHFVSLAVEEVMSQEYSKSHPFESCFLKFYASRWMVIRPLVENNWENHADAPVITDLCVKVFKSSTEDLLYARSHLIRFAKEAEAQTNLCTVLCVDLFHKIGTSSRSIIDKLSVSTHFFCPATWKALTRHHSAQKEAKHFLQWMYTEWLKSAQKAGGEALVEAYAACISSRNVFVSTEVDRLINDAHQRLDVRNYERIFLS